MRLAVAAALLLLASACLAAGPESFPAQCASPVSLAVVGDAVIVVDSANGLILGGNPKTGLGRMEVQGRARAAGSDEKGQAVVVTSDQAGNLKAAIYAGLRKLRVVDLKPSSPISGVTDAATKNEIIWVLQQTPPLVALFGADGAELSRTDLSSVTNAPFSLALGPSGEGYATDPIGPAVIEMNAFGQYKATHKLQGSGYTRPTGIAVGLGGAVWISDTVLGEAAQFTFKNKQLSRAEEVKPAALEDPIRLAVSSDALWILSGWNARLVKLPIK